MLSTGSFYQDDQMFASLNQQFGIYFFHMSMVTLDQNVACFGNAELFHLTNRTLKTALVSLSFIDVYTCWWWAFCSVTSDDAVVAL